MIGVTTNSGPDRLLGRLLEAAELRARVISTNIANQNTPGYTRRVVDFDSIRMHTWSQVCATNRSSSSRYRTRSSTPGPAAPRPIRSPTRDPQWTVGNVSLGTPSEQTLAPSRRVTCLRFERPLTRSDDVCKNKIRKRFAIENLIASADARYDVLEPKIISSWRKDGNLVSHGEESGPSNFPD